MDHKRVIDELTQGRELAKQLQIHLNNPYSSSHETEEILIQSILNSYDKSLSWLAATGIDGNGSNGESHLYAGMGITRLESPCSFNESPRSEDSDRDFKDPDHKDLSTKKKSNVCVEKWKHQVQVREEMGVEGALDDGYSWRKYGQKDILGAKHPRGYYRCAYRQVQSCFATKQVQRTDEDPNIFDITYLGRHTCNPGSHVASPPPLPLPPSREIQQPSQQNQLIQPESPLNFQTGSKVITENLDTPSFHFPSTSNNNFIFPTLDNTCHGNVSPSFVSPLTSSSTYFTMSQPQMSEVEGNQSVVVAESKLNNIVFTFGEFESGSNFNFGDSIFFD